MLIRKKALILSTAAVVLLGLANATTQDINDSLPQRVLKSTKKQTSKYNDDSDDEDSDDEDD